MRREAGHLREGRRTQTVTWHQLDEALAVLATNLRRTLVDSEGISKRLSTLAVGAETLADIALALATERSDDTGPDMLFWANATRSAIESHRRDIDGSAEAAASLAARLDPGGGRAGDSSRDGVRLSLDHDRKLLSIGYLVAEGTLDPSWYDLLASEAQLASFMAIAKGDVPARHWFHLGRAPSP
jgi:cyclic beta-1,2-glucan synthetase